jgi:uncharacterized protein
VSLSQTTILVFARAPVPGRCKTRLAPKYGARGAARIHRQLVLRTLATAADSGATIELWCEPHARHGFFLSCRRRFGARLRRQAAGDLGRKMALALADRLATGAPRVLLLGTDCPALALDDLQRASAALDDVDVVLQPAEDGGYVLIGARRIAPAALRGIRWSAGVELGQTQTRLRRLGLRAHLLPTLWDVDWPADVRRARRAGLY